MNAPRAADSSAWKDRAATAAATVGATFTSSRANRVYHAVGLAVPVLLVNTVAFFGQFGYLRDHLPWPVAGVVLAALALESIAIYLQWHAHLAQMSNDSALRLRLASYFLALGIGVLNYSHYAGPRWAPTAAAVICGLMSVISPWLWSVHSRRVSRDELMARGLVEEHALRLGATRWTWHPARAIRVMHNATWSGETSPARAIAAYGKPKWPTTVPPRAASPRAAVPVAVPGERAAIGTEPWTGPAVPEPAPVPAVHQGDVALTAVPSLPHQLSEDRIEEVELELAGMDMDQLQALTYREVSRKLGKDGDWRRHGKRLLDAARLARQQAPAPPPNGARPARPGAIQHIAAPAGHLPGGVARGG